MKILVQKWGLPALTLLTFFFLLGNRPLNEPDEGRYTEIAREMIETGNWLVPHLWYLPHLDKPPMTYWVIAASMKLFGQNEWAARLPAALAGISGVSAAFLLGCSLGGRRVGIWSALILQCSVLYFLMARTLTTDIFLTQFIAWAMYFFWRSWTALEHGKFFAWHLAGWVAIALGFLTKGPIALAIPLVSLVALLLFRRDRALKMVPAMLAGLVLFFAVAAPWFLLVFRQVPDAAHYMILGQAAGHLLGTTIKNRTGFPGYFFGVLALGLLPWTLLLGWLWRRSHWRGLDPRAQDGWLLLNVWAIFTFTLFSLSHAKLAPYILPLFPALAVMLAWRFFGTETSDESAPKMIWRTALAISFLAPAIFPFLVSFVFHDSLPLWLKCQTPAALLIIVFILFLARHWKSPTMAALSVGLVLLTFYATLAEFPLFPINFKANEPLNRIGLALRRNFQPGDAIICVGSNLPQGLPFYAGGLISAANRPYLSEMDLDKVPFEFPGNRERLGSLYLDENSLATLLRGPRGILVVGYGDALENFQKRRRDIRLRPIIQCGRWTLYAKDPALAGASPFLLNNISPAEIIRFSGYENLIARAGALGRQSFAESPFASR